MAAWVADVLVAVAAGGDDVPGVVAGGCAAFGVVGDFLLVGAGVAPVAGHLGAPAFPVGAASLARVAGEHPGTEASPCPGAASGP